MLSEQREGWRKEFEAGEKPPAMKKLICDYKANRSSESWRLSKMYEQLLEYVVYLESEIEKSTPE